MQHSTLTNERPKPRLVRRTLQDNVYEHLREALMAGEFAPGDHLTVRAVAVSIGTSIMPVRDAFRRLTSEGALEPLATGETRVPILDLAKLQDLTEIRMTVEGLAVRRAAVRITQAELKALELAQADVIRAAKSGDVGAEARANERFHFAIYRIAQSAELLRIIEHLWLQVGPYLAWLLKRGAWPKKSRAWAGFHHHKEILTALRAGDATRAEAALRSDLGTAVTVLLEQAQVLPIASD
jgi:DNA-binding GntR family transcriptional regulator